jgi:hypothetical protein
MSGNRYVFVIMDECNRYTWVFFKKKNQKMKLFINL